MQREADDYSTHSRWYEFELRNHENINILEKY